MAGNRPKLASRLQAAIAFSDAFAATCHAAPRAIRTPSAPLRRTAEPPQGSGRSTQSPDYSGGGSAGAERRGTPRGRRTTLAGDPSLPPSPAGAAPPDAPAAPPAPPPAGGPASP